MPRTKIIRQNLYPYHVSTKANHGWWYEIPLNETYELFIHSLKYALAKAPANLHAFILMSNHYHLLLTTPDANIDTFMRFLNSEFSKNLRQKTQLPNRMFGKRYHSTIIKNENYLLNCYRYIFQNSIRANIVKKGFDYPFSSFTDPKYIKLDVHLDMEKQESKIWLEQAIPTDEIHFFRSALKRREMALLVDRNKKRVTMTQPST
jgi:putative transposase